MEELDRAARKIEARIAYFGPAGAGTTTNLTRIAESLRRPQRGEIRTEHAEEDPTASYETLPIDLGIVKGYETSLQVFTVPGAPGLEATRRRILEGVHGIVFVADLRPEQHDATQEALEELRGHLQERADGGSEVILLTQYNRRDQADENALDALHRRLGLAPSASFEAVAHQGIGVLQTLTSVSRLTLASLRAKAESTPAEAEAPAAPAKGFRVESAGPPEGTAQGLRVPIRLIEEASGRRLDLSLQLSIDEA